MRRCLLLILGFAAGGCVFLILLFVNTENIPSYGTPVLAIVETTASDGPEYVASIASADITFPRVVEGTPLLIEDMTGYDGPFVEDGSDEEVANVAALILRNVGSVGVERASVSLERGDLRLTFEVSNLPPGAAVLVAEKNRQSCPQRNFTACTGWAEQSGESWLGGGSVGIEEMGMGMIAVTNITAEPLEKVSLFYKTYYREGGLYLGGMTYQLDAGALAPGETKQLLPQHYAAGYSHIVKVQIG